MSEEIAQQSKVNAQNHGFPSNIPDDASEPMAWYLLPELQGFYRSEECKATSRDGKRIRQGMLPVEFIL